MKRALAGALLVFVLCAGTASGDTFAVVSSTDSSSSSGFSLVSGGLPSAQVPNGAGSLALPLAWTAQAGQETPVTSAQLRGIWQSAGSAYGIPWSVLAAINKVESNFGRNMGPSSAGAIGWMQFMPDTWLRWGADYDGDGVADPWNAKDAVFSAARYLAAAGGTGDISRGVFAYNHAQWYVDEVLSLAGLLASDGSLSFSLDELQVNLEKAERRVASLSQEIAQTRAQASAIGRRARRMLAAAETMTLIDARSAARARAAQVQLEANSIEARLPELSAALEKAMKSLASARASSQPQSFSSGTSVYLASALYQNGYVFPVGGGPSRVSVGHSHHDYPAADIAAPAGSPVYALSDGVVAKAWRSIDPLCGIGLRFRTNDGQTWTYCHLSYIEPTVVTGTPLTAGTLIGLVGSTGHSTGPHLHLGLIPSSNGYPQDQTWFQSFADIAYRWQDESTQSVSIVSTALSSPLIFAVVNGTAGESTTSTWTVSSQSVSASMVSESSLPSDASASESSPFAAAPVSSALPNSSASTDSATSRQGSALPFSN
jgi:murein DD-endopeptidase MepM/ murein hydrolase activator NlpD